jgi:hypothetical protein
VCLDDLIHCPVLVAEHEQDAHLEAPAETLGLPYVRTLIAPGTRAPMSRNKQKVAGGGRFKSEEQRRFMWARAPKAAKKWAHNARTRTSDWRGAHSVRKGKGHSTRSR